MVISSPRAGRALHGVRPLALIGTGLLTLALVGCTDNAPAAPASADTAVLTVKASDTGCDVSRATAPAGKITFSVSNTGSQVNEFYLLDQDGLRIVGEVENIGPGLTRDLVVTVPAGKYFAACKPGMAGDGIRSEFTVTASGKDGQVVGDNTELVKQANSRYAAYVRDQTEQLLTKTETFVNLYTTGKDAGARALYPAARMHWERVEPVAESFGDLDPKTDLREADLAPGQKWTGWHRIEKDLWPVRANGYRPLSSSERATYGRDLLANISTLYDRTRTITFGADQIANGATGLLDEIAKTKVTGEEEYWSRTDLWDFQANIDGARVAYEGLRPLLKESDPELDTQISSRFTAVQKLLDAQKVGNGYKLYDDLAPAEVKQLSDAVNALSEPLSKLAASVV